MSTENTQKTNKTIETTIVSPKTTTTTTTTTSTPVMKKKALERLEKICKEKGEYRRGIWKSEKLIELAQSNEDIHKYNQNIIEAKECIETLLKKEREVLKEIEQFGGKVTEKVKQMKSRPIFTSVYGVFMYRNKGTGSLKEMIEMYKESKREDTDEYKESKRIYTEFKKTTGYRHINSYNVFIGKMFKIEDVDKKSLSKLWGEHKEKRTDLYQECVKESRQMRDHARQVVIEAAV